MGQYFDWPSAIWIMGELPYEKGRSMSHYPQAKLDELAEILAEEHADLKPEPGTEGKNFRAGYDCRPIFFYDRVLWVSEECLTDEDDGPDTAENAARALGKLDLAHHLRDPLDRELLLTHRPDSTPSIPPAKRVMSWGSWSLVVPR